MAERKNVLCVICPGCFIYFTTSSMSVPVYNFVEKMLKKYPGNPHVNVEPLYRKLGLSHSPLPRPEPAYTQSRIHAIKQLLAGPGMSNRVKERFVKVLEQCYLDLLLLRPDTNASASAESLAYRDIIQHLPLTDTELLAYGKVSAKHARWLATKSTSGTPPRLASLTGLPEGLFEKHIAPHLSNANTDRMYGAFKANNPVNGVRTARKVAMRKEFLWFVWLGTKFTKFQDVQTLHREVDRPLALHDDTGFQPPITLERRPAGVHIRGTRFAALLAVKSRSTSLHVFSTSDDTLVFDVSSYPGPPPAGTKTYISFHRGAHGAQVHPGLQLEANKIVKLDRV